MTQKNTDPTYTPALRWDFLTPLYDPLLMISGLGRSFKEQITHAIEPVKPNSLVLDIGCGTGTQVSILAERHTLARIVGIDPDQSLITRLTQENKQPTVTYRAAFADRLPFEDNSVDAALSTLTFHHLERAQKIAAFREAHRVLKPGSVFALTDWGVSPVPFHAFILVLVLERWSCIIDHERGRIPQFARDAGFIIESETRVKPSGIWTWKLRKPHN